MLDGLIIECFDDPFRPRRHLRVRLKFYVPADGDATELLILCENELGAVVGRASLRLPIPVSVTRVRKSPSGTLRSEQVGKKADVHRKEKQAKPLVATTA